MIEYKITTTCICYVEAETEEEACEQFSNGIGDYGDVDDVTIEELN